MEGLANQINKADATIRGGENSSNELTERNELV